MEQLTTYQPFISIDKAEARANAILQRMRVEEKIELIGGYNLFFIRGFEEYGIPELYLADSTQGVHIRRELDNRMEKSTAFPCPLALSATWNTQLAYQYAKAIGEECRAGGIAVLLGPGMNIYRISQCGRNFEYFGEDPFLAARMVENYVVGVQETGTMATLKHFLCNNTDHHRRRSNSVVDERTVREIYTPAFKAGIDAGALAVMTSYNQVNGEWTGQSKEVITDLLRNGLGFNGLVMSDWWSVFDPLKAIRSGLDLDMPGHYSDMLPPLKAFGDVYVRSNAAKLLAEGEITIGDIDRMAGNIIRTCIAAGLYDRPVKDESLLANFPAHEQIAYETACESIVLLRNENNLLPLEPRLGKRILLTGPFCNKIARGMGAAEVEGYNNITLHEALQLQYGSLLTYCEQPTPHDYRQADVVIVNIGTIDSECYDRPFTLPWAMDNLVMEAASHNANVVVVVNSGGGVDMSRWNHLVKAILYGWYPGQRGYLALAEIIAGKVCPSGKLPITIELRFDDSPGFGYKPVDEPLDTDWFGDLDITIPINNIHYTEGVFVGYRWYEAKDIKPLYPFGFGLSYSSFLYRNIKASHSRFPEDGVVDVSCEVVNTGKIAAKEVVQLYLRDVEASVPRPVKELKGFCKVLLEPGQCKEVTFQIQKSDLSFWDVESHSWKAESGLFEVMIGSSSDNVPLVVALVL
jgi:beta-glucosidase